MELFKKMGPRVILVEHKGRLTGLVTVKDCLKYQFQLEAQERNEGGESRSDRVERWLWDRFRRFGGVVKDMAGKWSGGKIRLGPVADGEGLLTGRSVDPRDRREGISGGILDGTEEADDVELSPRESEDIAR